MGVDLWFHSDEEQAKARLLDQEVDGQRAVKTIFNELV